MNDATRRYESLNCWIMPSPFVEEWKIQNTHIDHYQHTNNVSYLSQLESLAWSHSQALGLCFEDYQAIDRAMVITSHELKYHAPSYLDDTLLCATWIVHCDERFKLQRKFQFIRESDQATIFSAKTDFVCVSLSTGRPKKMPEIFKSIYGNATKSELS